MKKLIMNPRALFIAMLSTVAMGMANPVFANDDKGVIPVEKKSIAVELKHIGNHESGPLFALTFSDAAATQYIVSVKDAYGEVLYREVVKGGNVTKKFLLNESEVGGVAVIFEVSADKNFRPAVFEVIKSSRVVDDLVVSRR